MARAGHERAFEALVQRYRRPLLRYCRRMSIPENRAEDVVQQSLLQAWSALRRGAAVGQLRPWLYRIVHNTALNLLRDGARDGTAHAVELDGAELAEPSPIEPDLAGGLALRDALTGMATLPHMQREVIFRTAFAGYSHEEVASALGISDGAVRGLLYRARATLRTAITALTPPPLLSWVVGSGQGSGSAERIGELAASGGGIGFGGLLLKGGLAVVTAGTLVTGAAIVQERSPSHPHAHGSAASGTGAAVAASPAFDVADASTGGGSSTVERAAGVSSRRASGPGHRGSVRLRVKAVAPDASGQLPITAPQHDSSTPKVTSPTTYTVHLPGSGDGASPPEAGSGSPPASGSAPGGTSGGSSGGGSAGGGSQEPPAGGESGSGSGTGHEEPSGGGSESSSPPPSGGSGSPSTGPVGTVVHEVTGVLEHTVGGVLGHSH
jgi:RNA polymerase sigma factor (sigma-70 family)